MLPRSPRWWRLKRRSCRRPRRRPRRDPAAGSAAGSAAGCADTTDCCRGSPRCAAGRRAAL
jgi:hypothetical protein